MNTPETDVGTSIEEPTMKKYELKWQFEPRVATEHLGVRKYPSTVMAVRELVANALAANAMAVQISLQENDISGIDSVIIKDDGQGISPEELRNRFMVVGVLPEATPPGSVSLGQFGIGRLAVFRIGSVSEWNSVSSDNEGNRVRIRFTLRENEPQAPLEISEEPVPNEIPLGTMITVYNIHDEGNGRLSQNTIKSDLLGHFCGYLIAHPRKQIYVQGAAVDVESVIESREVEVLQGAELPAGGASMTHLILRHALEKSIFQYQLVFAAKGRTVISEELDDPPLPQYLGIVECPYLETIITSNREQLVEMDETFNRIRDHIRLRVGAFGEKVRERRKRSFIERARRESFYPYPAVPKSIVVEAERAIFDVALERVNENINVEGMTQRQRQVVFRLLKRVLENEDILVVLDEIARLSNADVAKFKAVLERTTLQQIINLSSIVAGRLDFLDMLNELTYGDIAKKVKERSQLHRILEPHCWIFGAKFDMATSDQNFRNVVKKHRILAGLGDPDISVPDPIKGMDDIPDLFLAASRDYPIMPKHHHVLVEIKAPSVSLGKKERDQIRRYAETIMDASEFDKASTHYDLFLVSAKASKEIDRDRKQKDKPYGCLWEWDNMSVWAFEWSEIIARSKEEMTLVRDNLERKSRQLSVSEAVRREFPDILSGLDDDGK